MKLSIGDVEKITGISKDRIRYYEKKNLIDPERNEENSYRSYNIEEVIKLLGIQLYRDMDMGVKEIQSVQNAESPEKMRCVFAKRLDDISAHITELQRQYECIRRCIDDCNKVEKHLDKISVQTVTGFHLNDRLDSFFIVTEYEKFRNDPDGQRVIIRSFVRRLELTDEGIGENAVFVLEEDGCEQIECVYTIITEESGQDPMMETYAKCMKWITENNVVVDKYCYVRPLLISNLGDSVGSYLEIIIPLKKNKRDT